MCGRTLIEKKGDAREKEKLEKKKARACRRLRGIVEDPNLP